MKMKKLKLNAVWLAQPQPWLVAHLQCLLSAREDSECLQRVLVEAKDQKAAAYVMDEICRACSS